jgi:peptidoglycan hydrolase-like protein with peptidoglycan-binding domain
MGGRSVISAGVGFGAINQAGDTRLVQRLLNDVRAREGDQQLAVDGIAGPKTAAAIKQYQSGHGLVADGRIDPDGPTLKQLLKAHLDSLQAGLIMPYIARGTLGAIPPPDNDLVSSTLRSYIDSMKS